MKNSRHVMWKISLEIIAGGEEGAPPQTSKLSQAGSWLEGVPQVNCPTPPFEAIGNAIGSLLTLAYQLPQVFHPLPDGQVMLDCIAETLCVAGPEEDADEV